MGMSNTRKGGIAVRQLAKLSNDGEFQKACRVFLDRLQGDDDARSHASLMNLDAYKDNPAAFVSRVSEGLRYQRRRSIEGMVRKASKCKGIRIVHNCPEYLIVSPENHRYSRKAAYLDHGKASWCIAAPGDEAKKSWEMYDLRAVFYIYQKTGRGNSWAMGLSRGHFLRMRAGKPLSRGEYPFSKFETRRNIFSYKPKAQKRAFMRMLKAIGCGRKEFEKIIVDHCASVEFYESPSETAWYAVRDACLVEEGSKPEDLTRERMDALLDVEGVDVNVVPSKSRWTMLHYVAFEGNLPVVETLLAHGADPSVPDRHPGDTPICLVHDDNAFEVVKALWNAGGRFPAIEEEDKDWYRGNNLNRFCRGNTNKILEWLVEQDPSLLQGGLYTPLHEAATNAVVSNVSQGSYDPIRTVRFLVSRGLDINAKSAHNQTPLMVAINHNNIPMAKEIMRLGGRVCAVENSKKATDEPEVKDVPQSDDPCYIMRLRREPTEHSGMLAFLKRNRIPFKPWFAN